ncbi:hemicentin-1-like isoform X2 [Corticium candelabrum]|nr:hemicentin-1-like isoform X2 [Corticium candelabrum]
MGLHNFTYLHLSNNQLKYIQEGTFIDAPNLNTVYLFDNLIVCDCGATWLFEFLRNRWLDTVYCAAPSYLVGKKLGNMTKHEFCGAPEFYVQPMPTMYAQAGQIVTLTCGAIGTPRPHIFWSFEKTPIMGSYRHSVTDHGDLVISDSMYTDAGTYHCTATSDAGAIAASAELIIGDRPHFNESFSGDIGRVGEAGVDVGGTAVLHCPLKADPAPNFVWSFGGDLVDVTSGRFVVMDDGSLVVVDVRGSDLGRYTCMAMNSIGTAVYVIDLIEFEQPTVQTTLHSQTATPGANVNLHCIIDGYPPLSFHWYHNNTLIVHDGVVILPESTTEPPVGRNLSNDTQTSRMEGSGVDIPTLTTLEPSVLLAGLRSEFNGMVLTIFNASVSDSGRYECRGMNSLGSAQSSAYVLIGDAGKPSVVVYPQQLTVTSGFSASLYCNASGFPQPTVRWTFNGETISRDSSHTVVLPDNSLVITSVELSDSGSYRCHAENVGGRVSAAIQLVVQNPPTFLQLSNDTSAMGWSTVLLQCTIDRTVKPPITLWWYFNGQRLSNETHPRHHALADGRLVIDEVEASDAGLYTCRAENSAGAISNSIVLDVYMPVKISQGPSASAALIGSAAVFRCEANGSPPPTYGWRINGALVEDIPKRYETRGNMLIISDVKRSDEGVVTCVASNGNQSMRADARLDVLVAPFSVQAVSDVAETKGRTAKLACAVDGSPKPEVTWKKDGRNLTSDVRYRISAGVSSVLAIDRLKLADSGRYTCVATSPLGSVSSSANLQVYELPISRVDLYTQQTRRIRGSVTFPCDATGVPPPRIIWLTESGGPLPDNIRYSVSKEGSLIILDLQLQDAGEFVCRAENAAGYINATYATLQVDDPTSPPRITVCPRARTARLGQEAVFECFAVGHPMPTIRWLFNGENVTSGKGGFNVSSDGTLRIDVKRRHGGEMTCVAENKLGVDMFSTSLTVFVAPTFTAKPLDSRQANGRDVLLHCGAEGWSTPRISWAKLPNNNLPFDQMRHFILQNGSLMITNVRKSDEGSYVCSAVNALGTVKSTARLLVEGETVSTDEVLMEWTRLPENVTIREGRTAVFHCQVRSNPPATYSWSYNGSRIDGEMERQFVTLNGSLVIGDVDYLVEGAYTCVASDGNTSLQQTVYLKTLVAPDIFSSPKSLALPWTYFNGTVDSASFSCQASGFPLPTIYWTKDNRRLVGERFQVSRRGRLTIQPLRFEDGGEYTCIATSSAGSARKSATLLIQDNRPRDFCNPTSILHHVRYRDCRTETEVKNSRCEGHCFSQEYPDVIRPSTERKYCCRVEKTRMRNVNLLCPDGSRLEVFSPEVTRCRCAICMGAQNVVLPENEYRK